MKPDEQNPDKPLHHDEDVHFENVKESTIGSLTDTSDKKLALGETIIPVKEDTLGNSDFPALTEEEKQPKLPEKG